MAYTLFIYDERTDVVVSRMRTFTNLRRMLRWQAYLMERGFFTSTTVH